MAVILQTTLLLSLSNRFMLFAWYAHLISREGHGTWRRLRVGLLLSSSICCPANRIGHSMFSIEQLKILQEAIARTVFVPFAIVYMKKPPKLDFLRSGLCLVGAVYFAFRP